MSARVVPMRAQQLDIDGLFWIQTKAVTDERGTVREFFRTSGFGELGLPVPPRWEQLNMTWTRRGGLRGLHGEAMTKLVGVAWGEAFGVYVDARPGSGTRGVVVTAPLSVGVQVLVPPGVLNGFQAVSEPGCQYVYCFDDEWSPGMAGIAVTPLDPALGIEWPIAIQPGDASQVSVKDAAAPLFADLLAS